jgi:hypothetical protein
METNRSVAQEVRVSEDITLKARPVVAVVGATGHTAHFVINELLRRKMLPVAIARNAEALAMAIFPGEVIRRHACLDDAESLDSALRGADAIINCAGPFIDSAHQVVAAAVRARVHYVDVTAEEPSVRRTLETFDTSARMAGIAVIPSVGFYGAFADLLVTAALGDWDSADAVDLMVGLDSWHPTLGTRKTITRLSDLQEAAAPGRESRPPIKKYWDFGDPLGTQEIVEFSLTESLLILRHIRTSVLRTYLSTVALSDVGDPSTPTPKAIDEVGRSGQRFVVEALVARGFERRRAAASGMDSYAFTAPLACEVVARLLDPKFRAAGAYAPGEILDARDILTALSPEPLAFAVSA